MFRSNTRFLVGASLAWLVVCALSSLTTAAVIPDLLYVQMEEPYWDGTPNEVKDSSGMGNDGTAGATASVFGGGYIGQAGDFTGATNSLLDFGSGAGLIPTHGTTLEAWVRPKDIDNWAKSGMVIIRPSRYYLKVRKSDGAIGAYFLNGNNQWFYGDTDIRSFGDSWTHIAARYDPNPDSDGHRETLWMNGEKVGGWAGGTGSISNYAVPTRIGYDTYWGHFKGLIDEAGIHNRALTDAEIVERASMAGTVHGPDVLYYRMEDPLWNGTAGEVTDSSARHPGTAVGDAQVDPNGWYNQAGSFDGTGDYISAGNSADLVPRSELTLAAWIKPDDFSTWAHPGSVIARSGSYYLEVNTNGALRFYLYGTTQSGWLYGPSLSAYGDEWVHVAATYNGLEKSLFVNGVKVASHGATGLVTASTSSTYIGYVDSNRYFKGMIDEAAVFSWALSEDQIMARYQYVPEPTSAALAGLAMIGFGIFVGRGRRRKSRG